MSASPLADATNIKAAKDVQKQIQQDYVGRPEVANAREIIESSSTDYGTIDVADESIPITDTLGLGRRARLGKRALDADDSGDDREALGAILDLIDALNECTPESYDQDYWDGLGDTDVRSAFQQLGKQSAGGSNAGK